MDKAFGKIYGIFIAINCLAAFWLFGMPKFYTNKYHFTAVPIRPHFSNYYSPVKDITVTAEDGTSYTITPNDRIATYDFDKINEEIERAMKGDRGEQNDSAGARTDGNKIVDLHVLKDLYSSKFKFKLKYQELNDPAKFKEVTEQVDKEYEANAALQKEKGEREYTEYMFNQKIWFILPHKYPGNFIAGLLAAGFAFFINFLLGRKHPGWAAVLSLAMTGLKIMGIIYWYINPWVCL